MRHLVIGTVWSRRYTQEVSPDEDDKQESECNCQTRHPSPAALRLAHLLTGQMCQNALFQLRPRLCSRTSTQRSREPFIIEGLEFVLVLLVHNLTSRFCKLLHTFAQLPPRTEDAATNRGL